MIHFGLGGGGGVGLLLVFMHKVNTKLISKNKLQNVTCFIFPLLFIFCIPVDSRLDLKYIKDIVQPKKRGVERGTIRTVLTSYTIADIF
jgi:hypothetical protein